MVTKKAILVVFCILLLVMLGCSKVWRTELDMQRKPYLGTDLRLDGYYYSTPIKKEEMTIFLFYRNGISIFFFAGGNNDEDVLKSIENRILLNEKVLSTIGSEPHSIGVFQINGKYIEVENFIGRGFRHTYKAYGEIINDSTIIINDLSGIDGKREAWNIKYKFKKFSPKPDSTSVYIP